MVEEQLRHHAREIWDAAVAAVRPDELVRRAVTDSGPLKDALAAARRIFVVGGGKAGAGMAAGLDAGLADRLDRVSGLVNVPAGLERPLQRIHLIPVRSAGSNQPTAEAVARTAEMLTLAAAATAEDVVVCLLSGGGSALLPAPAEGITLVDKQAVTRLLHKCGATINEMNCVRKHLSRFKGGGLARASTAGQLFSLILSDVVGDPLDVIASGPTSPDPTTFADALDVVRRYNLLERIPPAVRVRLEYGATGKVPDTLKQLPPNVHNLIVGNNALALAAAQSRADSLGYRVVNLGSDVEGESSQLAVSVVELARTVFVEGKPVAPPACILVGGETTVRLTPDHGAGGRNSEFALAAVIEIERLGLRHVVILSGGTDGEDGPTDCAGAVVSSSTLIRARAAALDVADYLRRHDSYTFFSATGDLLKTGLTGTNVMDVRVMLIGIQG